MASPIAVFDCSDTVRHVLCTMCRMALFEGTDPAPSPAECWLSAVCSHQAEAAWLHVAHHMNSKSANVTPGLV
ncbi:MAG: hypothetical protein ABL893_01605, partial [Hyphomicrobium sp.]